MAIDPEQQLSGEEALAKIGALLKKFPIAVMITVDADGSAMARPIGVVGGDDAFDGTLWFITDERSRKVAAIRGGGSTSLMFQNDAEGCYLHLNGRASIVEDRDRLTELYTPVQRTWFPDGVEDPHITLIRFDASEGRYWENHNGMLRLAVAFAKSVVTGTPGSSGDTGVARLD